MNALSIVWPGFTAARRIARSPVRFLVAGLEACVDFGRDVSIPGFRWLAALVMFALVFGCGAAAMTWPFAIAGLTYAAHIGDSWICCPGHAVRDCSRLLGLAHSSGDRAMSPLIHNSCDAVENCEVTRTEIMKIKIAILVLALVALVGCGEQKMNQVMPKAATTDAVYSAKASQYLEDALGTPKAKKIEMTFWNEKSNPDTGYLSLIIDGVEKIRPIDNYGGVNRRTASTDGFKFVFESGTWRAYVAEKDIETHGEHPQEFYNEMTGILRRY